MLPDRSAPVRTAPRWVEVDPASLPGARLGLARDALDPRFDCLADVERWKNVEELPVQVYRLAGR